MDTGPTQKPTGKICTYDGGGDADADADAATRRTCTRAGAEEDRAGRLRVRSEETDGRMVR